MFFLYGLGSSQGQTSETRPWKEANAYRPPHLRGKIKSPASTSSGSTGMANESSSREFSFDSDQSDSDGSISDNDRYKSSRCRITAISAIQVFLFPPHGTTTLCKICILIETHCFCNVPCLVDQFRIVHMCSEEGLDWLSSHSISQWSPYTGRSSH